MQTLSLHDLELALWSARAHDYDDLFAPVAAQAIGPILDALGPRRGRRHLDVACGTGHLVAAAAASGASEGVDFAAPMVARARANYPWATFRQADATCLPYDDESFTAVSCAFGLSHMDDPQAAVDEIYRVLRPGGRFAFTLWYGAAGGNVLLAIAQAAIAAHRVVEVELPPDWTRLRYADRDACASLLADAGFGPPQFRHLDISLLPSTPAAALDLLDKLSIRGRAVLERQPRAVQQRIRQSILDTLAAGGVDGIVTLPWPALLVAAEKPR